MQKKAPSVVHLFLNESGEGEGGKDDVKAGRYKCGGRCQTACTVLYNTFPSPGRASPAASSELMMFARVGPSK